MPWSGWKNCALYFTRGGGSGMEGSIYQAIKRLISIKREGIPRSRRKRFQPRVESYLHGWICFPSRNHSMRYSLGIITKKVFFFHSRFACIPSLQSLYPVFEANCRKFWTPLASWALKSGVSHRPILCGNHVIPRHEFNVPRFCALSFLSLLFRAALGAYRPSSGRDLQEKRRAQLWSNLGRCGSMSHMHYRRIFQDWWYFPLENGTMIGKIEREHWRVWITRVFG